MLAPKRSCPLRARLYHRLGFFGHRVTGQLFDDRDLEGLTMLAEHVSTILEMRFCMKKQPSKKRCRNAPEINPPGIVAITWTRLFVGLIRLPKKFLGLSGADTLSKPVKRSATDSPAFCAKHWKQRRRCRRSNGSTITLGDRFLSNAPNRRQRFAPRRGRGNPRFDRSRKLCARNKRCSIERRSGPTWPPACPTKFVIRLSRSRLLPNSCRSVSMTRIFARSSIRLWSMKSIGSMKLLRKSTTSRIHPSSCSKPIDVRSPVKKGVKLPGRAMASTAKWNWKLHCPVICRGVGR